eukprot:TRINITY_DN48855_c0_g1_i2.p1 TRINITY_DN48855_c0_g1~~TRINITY_DN48855_c0_g1_i2.p1  ORF type:complete len:810 (-),score=105.58 TRINITY_DN48855_c0_g1_i2:84-2513(-)
MSQCVRVMVRFRPLKANNTEQQTTKLAVKKERKEIQFGGLDKVFTFDNVFPQETAQEEVYREAGVPLLDAALQGYHGTIMAYGQTGSGKTHTMLGPDGGADATLQDPQKQGMIPRLTVELYERLNKMSTNEIEWRVQMSCMELYRDDIRDLLNPTPPQNIDYRIREDLVGNKGIYVENLKSVDCKNANELLSHISAASSARQTFSTQANNTSSRSHCIVVVDVQLINHVEGGLKTTGRLNLVDLAGSEKVSKTGAEGDRLKEAQTINLSLTLLGNVIYKLTDGKSVHIPYRDSKLTRLLQESLGGNAHTTLLCMCSPSGRDEPETMSTLNFAHRAKQIKNKPAPHKEIHVDQLRVEYAKAVEEIELLKSRVKFLEGNKPSASSSLQGADDSSGEQFAALQEQVNSLMRELQQTKDELYEKVEDVQRARQNSAFYQSKFETAEASAKDWKEKYLREKQACAAWIRKANAAPAAKKGAKPMMTSKPIAAGAGTTHKRKTSAGKTRKKGKSKDKEKSNTTTSSSSSSSATTTTTTTNTTTYEQEESPDEDETAQTDDTQLTDENVAALQVKELEAQVEELQKENQQQKERIAKFEITQKKMTEAMNKITGAMEDAKQTMYTLQNDNDHHKRAWQNKEKENQVLLAEIEAMRDDIKNSDQIPQKLKNMLLGSSMQQIEPMYTAVWKEATLLDQLAKTANKESSQREMIEIVAVDVMVKQEELFTMENDIQLLKQSAQQMTMAKKEHAEGVGRALAELIAYLKHEKAILQPKTFASAELESQRVNNVAELGDLIQKGELCMNHLGMLLQGGPSG